MDDGLAHDVEAGVQQDGNPGLPVEAVQQGMKAGVPVRLHRLQSPRAVDMHHGRHPVANAGFEAERPVHVRRALVILEIVRPVLVQNGRRVGPEAFAEFHRPVDLVHHLRGARIGQDRAVA